MGVDVGGTEVAVGTGVSVATGTSVAVGGTSVGVGGTTVGVLVGAGVGTGVDVGGVGTRVAVAGRVVGTTVSGTAVEVGIGACCSTVVDVGAAEGGFVAIGAAELDVQPDTTISTKMANSGDSRMAREILNDFLFTVAETTRSRFRSRRYSRKQLGELHESFSACSYQHWSAIASIIHS